MGVDMGEQRTLGLFDLVLGELVNLHDKALYFSCCTCSSQSILHHETITGLKALMQAHRRPVQFPARRWLHGYITHHTCSMRMFWSRESCILLLPCADEGPHAHPAVPRVCLPDRSGCVDILCCQ